MSENTKPNNERPADLAVQDSVGGMARRLLNPAHLRDLAGRSVKTLREQGAEQLWRDVKFRVGLAMHHDDWRHRADIPLRRELKAQRAAHLQGPKISIIVPLYNTPAKLFDEMLQSVVRQTYTNWELVLVDASDADKRLERRLPKTVPGTIVYEPIENGGIALNTTRGFALAHGEYITLLDHDDVLYPNALFEVVQTIQNTGADFVYSDEIVLSADLKELGGYHFKPDFAPDYLRGVNFITHLAVFSRPLLDAAGAYESKEFDGAQDHDLILRLTEKAQRIEHIKKVLYIWRAAAGSTAAGMEAKPYAVAAGERAIDAQLKRLGLPGHAMAVPDAPGAFQVRYELTGHPKISVLIPSKDHIDDLDRCLTSLYKNAGYDNFEVIVIENNSTDPATFAYYETLPSRFADCRVVYYKGAFNFSAINNFGRKAAQGEYLLLLNNDTEVEDDTLHYLCETLAGNPAIGAVCPKIRFFAPPRHIQFAGYTPLTHVTLRNALIGFGMPDDGSFDTPRDTPYAHGAAMMVRREVPRKAGPMPDIYFLYYEELDWSVRIREQGWKIAYDPRCTVFHKESATSGQQSPLRSYYLTRNRLLFAWRNLHGTARMLSVAYQLCIAVPKSIAAALAHGRRDLAKAIRHGAGGFFTLKNKTA